MPRRRTDGWASGAAVVSQFQLHQTPGTGGGSNSGGSSGGSAAQQPVLRPVTNQSEVTIPHQFTSKYVTVIIYAEDGFVLPQSRILEIECAEYSTRIAFHAPFTGMVKLTP